MPFTPELWKQQSQAKLQELLPRLRKAGVTTAYGILAAGALVPAAAAFSQGQPFEVMLALSSLVGNVGANLLTNQVQALKDKTDQQAAEELKAEAAQDQELRQALDRLLQQLEILQRPPAGLSQADRSWLVDTLRQELPGMGSTIEIGTVVFGDIYTEGGDVVKNKTVIINATKEPEEQLRAYYRSLAEECSRLPLGVMHERFATRQTISVDLVYTDLEVTQRPLDGKKALNLLRMDLERGDGDKRLGLIAAITGSKRKRFVLLGGAGSGKTTFVNYLTYLLATTYDTGEKPDLPEKIAGLMPVRIVLRRAAQHIPTDADCGTADMIWNALKSDLEKRLGGAVEEVFDYYRELIVSGRCLVLLDGLDEVPEAGKRRQCLLDAVSGFVDCIEKKKQYVLLTVRPYAYADPQWHLPDFEMLTLAPFSPKQVENFVAGWYKAVRLAVGLEEDAALIRAELLAQRLRERRYLADLASRPLLLTLIAALHASGGDLPEDRADLYEKSVQLLVVRWQQKEPPGSRSEQQADPLDEQVMNLDEKSLRGALEDLAYFIHERQGQDQDHREAEWPADIPFADILARFSARLPEEINPRLLLRYLENRAGLLVERVEGTYAFVHRSFQEYLAACSLTNRPRLVHNLRALLAADTGWWREVFLLAVGRRKSGGIDPAVSVLHELVPEGPDGLRKIEDFHWRLAALAGQALVELRLLGNPEWEQDYEALLRRTRRWLERLVEEGRLAAPERAEAGDVLAQLGDPRFDPQRFYLPCRFRSEPEPFLGLVEIPPGPFAMGSRKGEKEADDDEYGNPKILRCRTATGSPATRSPWRSTLNS